MKRCIVIGAMPIDFDIKPLIAKGDYIFCADAGYITCDKQGIIPDMIVGDFDSAIKPESSEAIVMQLPREKDETDTYYIANLIVEKQFTDVLLCGVTGGRADHTIASYQTLKYLSRHRINASIIDSNSSYIALTDGQITLPIIKDSYLSVISFGTVAQGVSITGAKYSLDNYDMTDDYPIGVSNEFCGTEVKISVNAGSVLIIITKKDNI